MRRELRRDRGGAPKRRSFAQGFAFGSATFAAQALTSLISAIATARLYGVTVVGQYALAYVPAGTIWYLSTIQEQPALVRKLAVLQPRAPRVTVLWSAVAAFSQTLTTVVVLVGAGVTVILFDGPLHHPGLIAPALVMLAGYLLLGNPGWNIDTLLASFRAARELFAVRFHQGAMFVVAAVILRTVTHTVWGPAIALLFSYGTSLMHRMWIGRRFLTWKIGRVELRDGIRELRAIVRFGLKVTPGQIASGLSSVIGTWILGALVPVAAVGAWSRATNVSQQLLNLNSRTSDMLLPTLVERQAAQDMAGFHRALVDSMRYVATILLLPAAAAGGAASGVLTLLFGPGFARAGGALVTLVLVPTVLGVTVFGSQALIAFNRPLTTTVLELCRLGLTAAAGVILADRYGSTGMGAAMLAGCLAEAVIVLTLMTRRLESPIFRLWPPRAMLALLLAYAGGFAASHFTARGIPGAAGTLAALAAGCAVYVTCVYVLGGVLGRDRQRMGEIVAARRRNSAKRQHAISSSVVANRHSNGVQVLTPDARPSDRASAPGRHGSPR